MIDAVLDGADFADDFDWVCQVFTEFFSGVTDTLRDVSFRKSLCGGAVFPGDAGIDFFCEEACDFARRV